MSETHLADHDDGDEFTIPPQRLDPAGSQDAMTDPEFSMAGLVPHGSAQSETGIGVLDVVNDALDQCRGATTSRLAVDARFRRGPTSYPENVESSWENVPRM